MNLSSDVQCPFEVVCEGLVDTEVLIVREGFEGNVSEVMTRFCGFKQLAEFESSFCSCDIHLHNVEGFYCLHSCA